MIEKCVEVLKYVNQCQIMSNIGIWTMVEKYLLNSYSRCEELVHVLTDEIMEKAER